jgi:hypothetical protein
MDLFIEDDLWWTARLCLSAWAGYQSRIGPYASIGKPEPSDGRVKFRIGPDGRGAQPLSSKELSAIAWFEANEPHVSAAVKAAILNWCGPYSFEPINYEDGLKRSMGLYSVNIHQLVCGGLSCIGYKFGCNWEEEHGLGVLMHGTRLADIGFADTALHLWVAQKDSASKP